MIDRRRYQRYKLFAIPIQIMSGPISFWDSSFSKRAKKPALFRPLKLAIE
jgi:hypothetical protein